MALFKILKGDSSNFNTDVSGENVSPAFNEGYCYFIKDNQKLYIDWLDGEERKRTALVGEKIVIELKSSNLINYNNNIYTFQIKNIKNILKNIIENNIQCQLCLLNYYYYNNLYKYNDTMYITGESECIETGSPKLQIILEVIDDDTVTIDFDKGYEIITATRSIKNGLIAVYKEVTHTNIQYITNEDLWHTYMSVNPTEDGEYILNDDSVKTLVNNHGDGLKIYIEPYTDSSIMSNAELFKIKKAYQTAQFTTQIYKDEGIIVITNTNELSKNMSNNQLYLKVFLFVDPSAAQS